MIKKNKLWLGLGVTFVLLLGISYSAIAEVSVWDLIIDKTSDKLVEEAGVINSDSLGAFPGGDMHGPVMIRDRFTQAPQVAATSTTGTAATLLERDLLRNQYHVVTQTGAADTDFTYTLPASSTISSLLPTVGSRTRQCWFNVASSSSVHTLIFAAGTGIDLVVASTTDDGLSVPIAIGAEEDTEVCFEFIRQPRADGTIARELGDITGVLETYVAAD